MNFQFMMECEIENPNIKLAYEQILKELEEAEAYYFREPQKSGILFRTTAEKICRFYNDYYAIGFPAETGLEEFLCYGEQEAHNVLVSRFFSTLKEQRDYFNKVRVLGDDCILGRDGADRGMEFSDRMAQDAEKMADAMMEIIKELCRRVNHRNDVDAYFFSAEKVPGYSAQEQFEKENVEETPKKTLFSRLFFRKSNT